MHQYRIALSERQPLLVALDLAAHVVVELLDEVVQLPLVAQLAEVFALAVCDSQRLVVNQIART